jgi:hypothetical protein
MGRVPAAETRPIRESSQPNRHENDATVPEHQSTYPIWRNFPEKIGETRAVCPGRAISPYSG